VCVCVCIHIYRLGRGPLDKRMSQPSNILCVWLAPRVSPPREDEAAIYTHTYISTYMCECAYIEYTSLSLSLFLSLYTHTHTHTHIHIYTHIYIYLYRCVCVCIYIFTGWAAAHSTNACRNHRMFSAFGSYPLSLSIYIYIGSGWTAVHSTSACRRHRIFSAFGSPLACLRHEGTEQRASS